MVLSPHSVGRQLVRAATASATTAFEFSLILQGKSSIAFAIAKAKSKQQQRGIESLESKLAAADAALSDTQEREVLLRAEANAYQLKLQELEAQIKKLKDAMQDQLSRQASQEASSAEQQQHLQAEVTTLTTQLAQQTSKAQIYETQYLQQDSNLRALHSQCFLIAEQLQHSQEQRQHLQAAVAEIQAEASAQATAAQQITQELESQLLQQSAAAEDYVIRSQAELKTLQVQIQQLQLQQYGGVASMEALSSKLVCTSASRSRLLGAAMVAVHTSDPMPNNIRQVLQEAVSAEEPSLLAVAAPVRTTPQAEVPKPSSQESPMPQPATPPRSRETSLPGAFTTSRPSRLRPLTLTLDETEAVVPSAQDSAHSSPSGSVPPSSPCEPDLTLQAAPPDDAQKRPMFVSPFEGHESLSEELPQLVDFPDLNWAAMMGPWATWASSDPDDDANGYGPSTSGRKLSSDDDEDAPIASTSGRKLSSSDSEADSAQDEPTPSTPRRMHRAPSVEQPMPSTSGRSSSPQRRVLMQARRSQVQAAAAYARSKKRNAALRASANSSCSSVVVHVKQQRCQPGQWQYSFRR